MALYGWQMDLENVLCLKICGFLFFSQFLSKMKTIVAILNSFLFMFPFSEVAGTRKERQAKIILNSNDRQRGFAYI